MQYVKKKFYSLGGLWDYSGIIASLLCTFHCLLLPLFFSSLPLFGVEILENMGLEITTLGLSFLFGFLALRKNYNKKGVSMPVVLFVLGFLLLIINFLLHTQEWLFVGPAAMLITTAHILNFKTRRV